MTQKFRILYEDDDLVAIDKPSGFYVHPPEDQRHSCSLSLSCLHVLRDQTQTYLYPAHRLDRATSGVLIFAKSSIAARAMGEQFQNRQIEKRYLAVVRGYCEPTGEILHPLKRENSDTTAEALTRYQTLAQIELPLPNKKHSTSRYSLMQVNPKTGQKHQIRRHFTHISHPLIGDSAYGDMEHNRLFKNHFQTKGLLLRAESIAFEHPTSGERMRIIAKHRPPWHQIFDAFQVCSYVS